MTTFEMTFFGAAPIVPSILISIAAFIFGGYMGKPVDRATLDLFFFT